MGKEHINTIIVGAGPAGTSCGYMLAKNNRECLIIDRREFPRDKICGGGLTPKAHMLVDSMFDGIQYDYYSVKSIHMYYQKKYICNFPLETEIRNVVRRDFDYTLLTEYQKIGGRFFTDTVIDIKEEDNKIYITLLSGKTYSCDNLVGADGANSTVRKYLQPSFKKRYLWLDKVSSDTSKRDLKVYFDKRFKNGYMYLFPNLKGHVVGYGGKHTSVDEFHKCLDEYDLMIDSKTKGAYIPMSDGLDYPFRQNILLIGDAGGYADSITGEGLYFALKSGQNAASSIISGGEFLILNKNIIDIIKKRKKMARLFFFLPVHKLFMYMCTKPSLLKRINRRVHIALSQ